MPLRDYLNPPLSKRVSWEGFHGQWPAMIVLRLHPQLPPDFTAEPRVHLGSVEGDSLDQYEYEVLVFDQEHERRLVSAVELVSPGNRDRPESRRALVTKCASLLNQGMAPTIPTELPEITFL